MNMAVILDKPKVKISESLKALIKERTEEMGQVVLHISMKSISSQDFLIRIWPTSYLYDQGSDHASDLIHIENITYYPTWYLCPSGKPVNFTLVFSGLPKKCTTFDFVEHCTNQGGAFEVRNIARNNSDVYYLEV